MRELCAANGVTTPVCPLLPFFPLTVTVTQTGTSVQGTITLNSIVVDVTGTVSGGELNLSGRGSGIAGSVTLSEWKTMDRDGAMTGRFRYTIVTPPASGPLTVTSVLDSVVKAGATPVPAPLPEPPIRVRADPASTGRSSIETRYTACYWIENYASTPAQIRFTVTPIGGDGRDYDVEQVQTAGGASSILARGYLTGCGSAVARDTNASRPVAPTYRLRIDYQYADGTGGVVEENGSVTAR